MPSGELIFIYGTLRRGGRAHSMMHTAEYQGTAQTTGRLVHVNQYPGLILDSDSPVVGELYIADPALINELDQYEGCFETPQHYQRQEISVTNENGETLQAHTYVFQLLEPQHEPIESGDWLEWINR